ncbi:MAG: hypothetical protein RIS94_632 [Pseudomonadota bacterium]
MAQDDDLPDDRAEQQETSGAEQRSTPRFTLLIRVAKLIADDAEFLCIIRDASGGGVKVRLFSPIPAHATLALELANGDRLPAEMVWQEEDYAGLRFTDPVPVERLVDERSGGSGRRQVRLRIALDAVLHSGREAVRIAFQDISQQGARITCEKWLLMNELVRLETGVTPAVFAKVRWRQHPNYGLVFEQTFKLDELARISAPLTLTGTTDISRRAG